MNQISFSRPYGLAGSLVRPTSLNNGRVKSKAASLCTPMVLFLLVVSASYWYCLPVATQSVVRYSEFRGYDLLLLALSVVMLAKHRPKLMKVIRADVSGRWIFRFALWASATYPMTVVISVFGNRASWGLVTLVFLFHLWGFFFVFAAIRIWVKTRRQCFLLLDTFLLLALAEATVICLQGLGFLPRFWSELYGGYGEMAFSGTLGPNRTMPGHAMVLAIGVAFAYGRNFKAVGWKRLCLAAGVALLGLTALGFSASRTAWSTFGVFLILSLIGRRPQIGMIAFIMVVAIGVIGLLPDTAGQRITEIYQWRVGSKLSPASSTVAQEETDSPTSTMEKLDPKRVNLWTEGARAIIERPYLIPFGGGFNNYRYTVGVGVSAHNLYITLVGEVGIVGLFLYLSWLRGIWRESSQLINSATKAKKRGALVFLPVEMQTLLVAFMVSLLAGEILYPYRPAFTSMGMFLFVCAVLNHRSLVFGDDEPRARVSTPSWRPRARANRKRLIADPESATL
jgi:O-antigen ligase